MKILRSALPISLVLAPGCYAASRLRRSGRVARADPIVEAAQEITAAPQIPCACQCCQVVERLPAQYVTLPNGDVEKETCAFPVFPQDGDMRLSETAEASRCPAQCIHPDTLATTTTPVPGALSTLTDADGESGLANVTLKGLPSVLSEKFCRDDCEPVIPTIGTKCQRVGSGTTPAPLPGDDGLAPPGMKTVADDGTGFDTDMPSNDERVEAALDNNKPKTGPDFDLRSLVAGRLRAEAGAVMSHAALSGQQVKAAALAVKLDLGQTEQLTPVAAAAEGSLTGMGAGADQSSSDAMLASDEAVATMKKAEEEAPKLFMETKKLAAKMIQEKAAAAAEAEARLYAQRMAWDKPPSYGKLVAYRAAEPYGQMAAVAALRENQYTWRAQALEGQAAAARASVSEVPAHAAAMDELGDKLGAAAEREKISVAMQHASDLEREAQRSRDVAKDAHASEARWQTASNEAVEKAWNIYQANHPPQPITVAVGPAPR